MKRLFLLFPLMGLFGLPVRAQRYFQQGVDTKIEVRLDDKRHFLHGFESLHYTNHSQDTLRYIYIHLWPNAYSSDRTRFSEQQATNRSTTFYYSKASERGYIDSLDFRVNGKPATTYSTPGLPDIARLDLPAPLLPGESADIETPFRVKIPIVFSRMGHTGQAYYISQWFPKPAVYDRKGWHPLPYSDQGEFYSEIGTYDVEITLPKNYIVMATGNCTDAAENSWLDSLAARPLPDTVRPRHHIRKWRDSINRFPPSATELKTLHFHEEHIHDFAWFADKRFVLRKDTVRVEGGDDIPTHTVTIWAGALPSEVGYWTRATEYMKKTISYLSSAIGPYPYNTVKAVEGDLRAGGGMEYPTVTVIDRLATFSSVMETLVHEVGHNWFYGQLATNERDYPWLDEGFNTFYERKIERNIRLPMRRKEVYTNKVEDVLYYNAASTRADQSLSNTSSAYSKANYGQDVYYKAALLLGWLEGYMGTDTFGRAMQEYYRKWHFRHPYPDDVERVFQEQTRKPLDWFFDGALNTRKGIDFAVKRAHDNEGTTTVRVRNNSGFPAPVRINAYNGDSLLDSAWTPPFASDTTLLFGDKNRQARRWQVGYEIPDYYGFNNRYHRYGLLHGKSIRTKFGLSLGRREAAEVYILPAIGYNVYDGFMAGLLIHNLTVPQNRLRYTLAPLFGTRSSSFAGAGSIGYWIYPSRTFSEIVPQVDVKTFHFDTTSYNSTEVLRARYIKIAPSLTFVLSNSSPLGAITRSIMLKGYAIWEDGFSFDTLSKRLSLSKEQAKLYGLLRYSHINGRTFNSFSYILESQLGPGFAKLTAEGRLRIDYNLPRKGLHLRVFAGKYIATGTNEGSTDLRYWLTGTFTAANDYLYDGMYFGRGEQKGLAAQQVSIQEGGAKIGTPLYAFPLGRSDDWLASINIKTDIPRTSIPVRLYFDAVTYANAQLVSPTSSRILYTGGVEIHALRDIFLLHIPLLMSSDYHDYLKSIYPGKEFSHSISFSIQLQNVNWLRIISSAMKYYLY